MVFPTQIVELNLPLGKFACYFSEGAYHFSGEMAAFYLHGYPSTQVGRSSHTLLNFVQRTLRCTIGTYYDIRNYSMVVLGL